MKTKRNKRSHLKVAATVEANTQEEEEDDWSRQEGKVSRHCCPVEVYTVEWVSESLRACLETPESLGTDLGAESQIRGPPVFQV